MVKERLYLSEILSELFCKGTSLPLWNSLDKTFKQRDMRGQQRVFMGSDGAWVEAWVSETSFMILEKIRIERELRTIEETLDQLIREIAE